MKKRIALLGATGSIGKNAVDIILRNEGNDNFEVVLLTAHSSRRDLDILSGQFPNALCVLTGEANGNEALLSAIKNLKPDITINGISGAAGLMPSFAAIKAGSHLALANKESIVMAGQLVIRTANENNVKIIPVDSEHSAIFHLLKFFTQEQHIKNKLISEVILTASGGPFRNFSIEEMKKVTIEETLAHPTWNMGKKITIDSASMANKGLEIMEANALFCMPPDKIKVVIHPQSIIHSMIRLCNGVIYAQLSKPDMRHPIHDALYWPKTIPCNLEPVCFDSLSLDFFKPDLQKFPMLNHARTAAEKGALYPCVYNAANETAVAAFIDKKIGFTDIPLVTENVLQADWTGDSFDLEAILNADTNARIKAAEYINNGIKPYK